MTETYDVAGPADAPAIVFVHGTRLSRSMWHGQVRGLQDEFRVLALDLPGHGVLAHEPFTVRGAADRVGRVIEDAAGGHAVVVGLSLGGYVGMDLAARRPELVRGLVLSGATAEPIGLRSRPYQALAWAMERWDGPRLDAVNRWFFTRRFGPTVGGAISEGGFWSAGGAVALRSLIGERFADRLAAYPGPVLLINGAWDLPFRLFAPAFARRARDVRRVRLGRATHLANLDRPAAFNAAIRRFVRSLEPRD
jgi:pimeloyl-ACP methyl ester carboxylesterase